MWLLYVIIHVFLLSLTNYIDEYLTINTKVQERLDSHTKIGGLLLISTIFSYFGAVIIWLFVQDVHLEHLPLVLSLTSSIPIVIVFATYFYLLLRYPAYQVVPLFLISSVWLLLFESFSGETITFYSIVGILIVSLGAYFLDVGTFKWKIPSRLLLLSIPATTMWAIALFMMRVASETASPVIITFWQFLGIGTIGILLFIFVKRYREGLLLRIRHQSMNFLGFSFLNESLAQGAYFFGYLAIAAAPIAAYVTALSGLQGLFLLFFFFLFPLHKDRAKITRVHIVAILLITIGVFIMTTVA